MQLDLTDDEFAALVQLLKHTLDNDRFPHAPRLAPLRPSSPRSSRQSRASHSRRPRSMPRRALPPAGCGTA